VTDTDPDSGGTSPDANPRDESLETTVQALEARLDVLSTQVSRLREELHDERSSASSKATPIPKPLTGRRWLSQRSGLSTTTGVTSTSMVRLLMTDFKPLYNNWSHLKNLTSPVRQPFQSKRSALSFATRFAAISNTNQTDSK